MLLFEVVRAGSLVVDGLVFWFVLRRLTRPGGVPGIITLGPVLAAVLATAVAFVVKMAPLVIAGLGLFGVFAFVYADLVVLIPAVGAGLLFLSARRGPGGAARLCMTRPVYVLALASLALPAVGLYASVFEPRRLLLETADVPVAPARIGEAAVTIGVLADLQTDGVTAHEHAAVDRLMAESPDIILIPGDVFQGRASEYAAEGGAMRDLLAKLHAPGGVFVVLGNCDSPTTMRDMIEGTAIRLLVNEIVRTRVGDRAITIGGVELDYAAVDARRIIDRLEGEPGDADVRILVSHLPDSVLALRPSSRVDLVVAGHTHGGQVQLPLFGPPITLSQVPRSVAAGGLHRHEGNAVYVSRGVGMERHYAPRIRFLCPPEISVLHVGSSPAAASTISPDARKP